MIITSKLSWVHLPKTGGTTTDQLFTASNIPILWRDSQDSASKHLPFGMHSELTDFRMNSQIKVSNFRRLPSWLLSNHQHKLQRMGLELPLEYMRKGLFWRDRDQKWLPADWWLERFDIDDKWHFLRVEYLKTDFLHCLSKFEPVGIFSRFKIRSISSRNCNNYVHRLANWFSSSDLLSLYSMNPRWASIESELYGNLLIDSL